MSFLNICFSRNSVKSQPEVALSQDFFDFEPLDHNLAAAIPIPSSTIPSSELYQRSELDIYDVSSFGSFSSAVDSLVLDNAIMIPSYDSSSPPTTNIQDFYIFGDRDPLLLPPPSFSSSQQHDSSLLLSSSVCESDFSFCSTPIDDMLMLASPNGSSTDWLSTTMGSSPLDFDPSPSSTTLFNSTSTTLSPQPPNSNFSGDQLFASLPSCQENTSMESGSLCSSTIKKRSSRRKEYECPHCARKSNRSNNMKEHILTHDPNRPKNFYCTVCPKRFARKHDLKRHHQAHERCIEKIMIACGLNP